MNFKIKNTLKNNRNYTSKHSLYSNRKTFRHIINMNGILLSTFRHPILFPIL